MGSNPAFRSRLLRTPILPGPLAYVAPRVNAYLLVSSNSSIHPTVGAQSIVDVVGGIFERISPLQCAQARLGGVAYGLQLFDIFGDCFLEGCPQLCGFVLEMKQTQTPEPIIHTHRVSATMFVSPGDR